MAPGENESDTPVLRKKIRINNNNTVLITLFRPFEGNHKADVAPGENEFDTPGL